MRSVIEEIATAEQQAEEIRQNAALQARELTQKAKEDAQEALLRLENESRADMQAALETALQGMVAQKQERGTAVNESDDLTKNRA